MLEDGSLSFAVRNFRATFPKRKTGRAHPLLGYERPLCLLPGQRGPPACYSLLVPVKKRLKSFRPKVCRKVCSTLVNNRMRSRRSSLPVCPWLASRAQEVPSGEGHRSWVTLAQPGCEPSDRVLSPAFGVMTPGVSGLSVLN